MFKPEAFMICRDKANRNVIDHIKYPLIHCLNIYQKHSLYFKSRHCGYCLIFEESDDSSEFKKGHVCYKNLLLMQEQNQISKAKKTFGRAFNFRPDPTAPGPLL